MTASADHSDFSLKIRVYYEDTDFGGVVYYANYLKFMERARTEYLRSLGFDQSDLFANHRRQFVVRSASVEFVSPARFDDVLLVDAKISNVRRASLEFTQRCSVVESASVHGSVASASEPAVENAAVRKPAVKNPASSEGTFAGTTDGTDASPSGRLVATGKLLIACLDADSHKPRAIPGELKMSLHR